MDTRIHVFRTTKTRMGTMQAGTNYLVPRDIANELVADGLAISLDKPQAERAVREPQESREVLR